MSEECSQEIHIISVVHKLEAWAQLVKLGVHLFPPLAIWLFDRYVGLVKVEVEPVRAADVTPLSTPVRLPEFLLSLP